MSEQPTIETPPPVATQPGQPPKWLRQMGIFFAWAGGFAGAAVVIVVILVTVVSLFSATKFSKFLWNLSDWSFWASALLLVFGLIAPNEPGQNVSPGRKDQPARGSSSTSRAASADSKASGSEPSADSASKFEERRQRAIQKRIMRVYNPWRWRLWMAAILTFGVSVLMGLLATRP